MAPSKSSSPTQSDGTAPDRKPAQGGVLETIKVIAEALVIALVIRTFLFQPFNIPSGSLIPTLLVGDYVFVSKYSYGYSKYSFPLSPNLFSGRIWGGAPQRGDIAVFRKPGGSDEDYIKRVIGLPGDRIQMIKGVLNINGTPVKRVADGTFGYYDESGIWRSGPLYQETLPGGVTHPALELEGDSGRYDDTAEFHVPPGHYFMMGDNRDNSEDSRGLDVGYVPEENLIGKGQIVFFSVKDGASALAFWKWPWTVRFDRLMTRIR